MNNFFEKKKVNYYAGHSWRWVVGLVGPDERWMNVMLTLLLTIHSSRVCFLGFLVCRSAEKE